MPRTLSIPNVGSLLLAAVLFAAGPAAGAKGPVFKLFVEKTGVYALSFDDLQAAVPKLRPVESRSVALLGRGSEVPLRVRDGGDGEFGPGDRLYFVGRHLGGEHSYFDEHSTRNVYFLHLDRPGARRMRQSALEASPKPDTLGALLTAREHHERDKLMLRFAPEADGSIPESWYWAKLSQLNKKPFELVLRLGRMDFASRRPVALRIGLRGWSTQKGRTASSPDDHQVEVRWNGELVATGTWNGQKEHVIHLTRVPAEVLRAGKNDLLVTVPKRQRENGQTLVDVVLLNWVEVDYPHRGQVSKRQVALGADPVHPWLRLEAPAGKPLVVFGAAGSLIEGDEWSRHRDGRFEVHLAPKPPAEAELWPVVGDAYLAPAALELDRPSDLRSEERQADYLMITHPRLQEAIEPLARFHRQRGLGVEVVDVVDVYDEFSHGIVTPAAIRDFVAHAYHRWQAPAPRYVLLVGDASWDVKNKVADDRNYADHTFTPGADHRFVKNRSTAYEDSGHRNLVPTMQYFGNEGQAASDNYFVAVDGDDELPDLAIGRFPVVAPEDVEAIVEKTIRYMEASEVGPWRRNVLLVTNEAQISRIRSDRLARMLYGQGFQDHKVYPAPEEPSNAHHQAFLRNAISQGQLLVHFYGHGGRYIWRTGPPDLRKNHDLFTLDDLDRLRPTANLPVVLSMTCYSAPFDHPTADSIGEKFLRMGGKGAVAVFAASWRNSPSEQYSHELIEKLLEPGLVLGEAIRQAKQEAGRTTLVALYNLLGDPALELALPRHEVLLEERQASTRHLEEGMHRLRLAGEWRAPGKRLTGQGLVDWLDPEGNVLATTEVAVKKSRFEVTFQGTREQRDSLASARAYLWNGQKRLDGIGRIAIEPLPIDPETLARLEAEKAAARARDEAEKAEKARRAEQAAKATREGSGS